MHTRVYIIIPKGTTAYEKHVEEALGGSNFDKTKQFPVYETPCSCRSEIARNNAYNEFDDSENGKILLAKLSAARGISDIESEQYLLEKRYEQVRKLEEVDPQYSEIDPECDICDGKGFFEISCDPAVSYDWWNTSSM